MCTTKTHDVTPTLQQIARADGRAVTSCAACLAAGRTPTRCPSSPSTVEDSGDRRHPLPAEYMLSRDRTPDVRGAGERATSRNSTAGSPRSPGRRCIAGDPDPHRRQRRFAGPRLLQKYGNHARGAGRVRAVGGLAVREHGFGDIKRSASSTTTPVIMVAAYELPGCAVRLSAAPRRHREAGPAFQGTIKAPGRIRSAAVAGHRRHHPGNRCQRPTRRRGQGRHQILESLNLQPARSGIVSCPSCGRAPVDVYKLMANAVSAGLDGLDVPLRVAVMGCVGSTGLARPGRPDLGVARQRQGPDSSKVRSSRPQSPRRRS